MPPLEQFEAALAEMLVSAPEAVRWAVEGGGKRIRPQICLAAAVAAGGRTEDAVAPACAIELLHSYTLVHDDLPAMDNDTLRRGKPSVWAKFGEAGAILAGDALQALAFRAAARSPRNAARTVAALAAAACDVVRGQVEDLLEWDGAKVAAESRIEFIFENKTAALFVAAAEMGGLSADADEASLAALRSYARDLGFAFQYEDDLLDSGDGAFSSVAILGSDEVFRRVRAHTAAALAALAGLPGDAAALADIAVCCANRIEEN